MLFSLGRGGYAPEWMGKVSRNGVPHRALLACPLSIVTGEVCQRHPGVQRYGQWIASPNEPYFYQQRWTKMFLQDPPVPVTSQTFLTAIDPNFRTQQPLPPGVYPNRPHGAGGHRQLAGVHLRDRHGQRHEPHWRCSRWRQPRWPTSSPTASPSRRPPPCSTASSTTRPPSRRTTFGSPTPT